MVPYAVQVGDLRPEHLLALEVSRQVVARLPDGLTCHEVVARLAPDLPGWVPTRGWFGEPPAEHSWLVHRADPNVLLDPYPWACGSGPLLVVMCNPLNPWRFLYRVEKYNPGCWYVGPDVFGKYIA
jgi:hypothetical protein